jgi:hypothetical protein
MQRMTDEETEKRLEEMYASEDRLFTLAEEAYKVGRATPMIEAIIGSLWYQQERLRRQLVENVPHLTVGEMQ